MKTKLVFVGGLVVMLAFSSLALAGDGKEMSGAACHELSSTSGDIEHPNTGTVWNDSTSYSGGVVCPMVRDDLSGGGVIVNSTVYVVDQNDGASVSCTFYLCNRTGTSCSSSTKSSGTSFTGTTAMVFSQLTSSESRWFYMYCSIPAKDIGRSEVVSYTWSES